MNKYNMSEITNANPELKNEPTEAIAKENYANYFWLWFGIFFALGVIMIIITRQESLSVLKFVVVSIILIASILSSVAIHRVLRLIGQKIWLGSGFNSVNNSVRIFYLFFNH